MNPPGDPPETPPPPATVAAAASPESPWLGLRSFTEETRGYFFGRPAEVRDLYERIVHKPLTILFGQSGLGKTSLLQAALVPRLREAGYLPAPVRLIHGSNKSLEWQLIHAFQRALFKAGYAKVIPLETWEIKNLWLLFHDPASVFTGADDPRLGGLPPPRPVFLIDQFEEIFTLGERAECRQDSLAFRDALACLVENRVPEDIRVRLETDDDLADRLVYGARPAKVLITLREDFLHVLERWRKHMPSLMDNRYELRLLTGPQALQAVVEPGKLRGPDRPPIIPEETGAAIVRFVAGVGPEVPLTEIDAVPPLLSLICSELNARRFGADGGAVEDQVRPEQLGGRSEDILADFYRESFREVPGPVRALVEDRLLSADGFRESLALDSAHRVLETAGVEPGAARGALARLVDRRLLTVEERGGVRRVELTHDVLTGVARQSRDQRAEREAAERARREKEEIAARAVTQRRAIRRARLVGLGCALLALASLGALLWALAQRREAEAQSRAAQAASRQTEQANRQMEAALDREQVARQQAERSGSATNDALGKVRAQLHEASLSDVATATNLVAKKNWREAIAYLGRALHYDPDNKVAMSWLWSELVYGQAEPLPEFILPTGDDESPVVGTAYSPDGRRIITVRLDGSIQQWDAATSGERGRTDSRSTLIDTVIFSPDSQRILTIAEGESRQMDTATGTWLGDPLPLKYAIRDAAWRGDRRQFATVGGLVQRWDAATSKPVGREVEGDAAVYSPDGRSLAVADAKSLKRYDADTGKPVGKPIRLDSRESVQGLAYSPDAQMIVVASDKSIVQKALANGELLHARYSLDETVQGIAYSPDGQTLLNTSGASIQQWDAADTHLIGKLLHSDDFLTQAAYSPDGRYIVTVGRGVNERVKIWSAVPARASAEMLLCETVRSGGARIEAATYQPGGKRILTVCTDGTARQWDAATGQQIGKPLRHERTVRAAVYSPDGQRIATASEDGAARLWDARTGDAIGTPLLHGDDVACVAFSPDGLQLATGSTLGSGGGSIRQWDLATGKPIGDPIRCEAGVESICYRPDEGELVYCSGNAAYRRETTGMPPVGGPLKHRHDVHGAAYSPDGKRIVTAADDDSACLWETATGKALGALSDRGGSVRSAAWSPDGRFLITVGSGGIRLWDGDSGVGVGEINVNLPGIVSFDAATFSPDGRRILATAGGEAWQLDFDPPDSPPPAWLDRFLQMACGYRFNDRGELEALPLADRLALRADLTSELAALPAPSAPHWLPMACWFLTPEFERTILPENPLTVPALAEREVLSGVRTAVRDALHHLPDTPLAHLAWADFEDNAGSAAFLRSYDLARLPADPAVRLRAARMLAAQREGDPAIRLAREVAAAEPGNRAALKVIADCLLSLLNRPAEALPVYESIIALPDADGEDFARAGLMNVESHLVPRGRELLRQAQEKFPADPAVYRLQGWASVCLGSPADALVSFQKSGSLIQEDHDALPTGLLAGLAVARWQTGDKAGAVDSYLALVKAQRSYADKKGVEKLFWPDVEKTPLLAVLAETLRRHPELTPKP